jgi:hypothetical protein
VLRDLVLPGVLVLGPHRLRQEPVPCSAVPFWHKIRFWVLLSSIFNFSVSSPSCCCFGFVEPRFLLPTGQVLSQVLDLDCLRDFPAWGLKFWILIACVIFLLEDFFCRLQLLFRSRFAGPAPFIPARGLQSCVREHCARHQNPVFLSRCSASVFFFGPHFVIPCRACGLRGWFSIHSVFFFAGSDSLLRAQFFPCSAPEFVSPAQVLLVFIPRVRNCSAAKLTADFVLHALFSGRQCLNLVSIVSRRLWFLLWVMLQLMRALILSWLIGLKAFF